MIKLTGLSSELKKLQQVHTEVIDLEGLNSSKTLNVELELSQFKLKYTSNKTVKVFLKIGEKKINQIFYKIPLEHEGLSPKVRLRLSPKFVTITLQATPSTLKFLQRNKIRAFLDLRELSRGQYERKVQVKIPQDTALIEVKPEKVTVVIK